MLSFMNKKLFVFLKNIVNTFEKQKNSIKYSKSFYLIGNYILW